jgi:hypothetical protein
VRARHDPLQPPWVHDETRKSLGLGSSRVVDSVKLYLSGAALDGKHPKEAAEVVEAVRDVVGKLAAES